MDSERYQVDTDFLVWAVSSSGKERRRLLRIASSASDLRISAVAWYEFARGPRTAEQLAVARSLFGDEGVIALSEHLAALAAEVFRALGSPRRRAADIAIGTTAAASGATLLTRNAREFEGIPGLRVEGSVVE